MNAQSVLSMGQDALLMLLMVSAPVLLVVLLVGLVVSLLQAVRLDGLGLTRKLRDHPQFKTTPILMLTTESSDLMKQAGKAAGATGWLVKPFDPTRLVQVIKMVLQ